MGRASSPLAPEESLHDSVTGVPSVVVVAVGVASAWTGAVSGWTGAVHGVIDSVFDFGRALMDLRCVTCLWHQRSLDKCSRILLDSQTISHQSSSSSHSSRDGHGASACRKHAHSLCALILVLLRCEQRPLGHPPSERAILVFLPLLSLHLCTTLSPPASTTTFQCAGRSEKRLLLGEVGRKSRHEADRWQGLLDTLERMKLDSSS